uniref:Putative secreted protein n=1 Tax=Anopheles darlingi TaxID=43151 RepID=A0A2M4DLP0_ANODA
MIGELLVTLSLSQVSQGQPSSSSIFPANVCLGSVLSEAPSGSSYIFQSPSGRSAGRTFNHLVSPLLLVTVCDFRFRLQKRTLHPHPRPPRVVCVCPRFKTVAKLLTENVANPNPIIPLWWHRGWRSVQR